MVIKTTLLCVVADLCLTLLSIVSNDPREKFSQVMM